MVKGKEDVWTPFALSAFRVAWIASNTKQDFSHLRFVCGKVAAAAVERYKIVLSGVLHLMR